MKKFFAILVLVIVVVIAGAILYFDNTAADKTSRYLSEMFHTDTKVQKIDLSWRNLRVASISIGSSVNDAAMPAAFKADLITIRFDPQTFFADVMHIEEIAIENASIGIDFQNVDGSDNTWVELLNQLPAFNSSSNVNDQKRFTINRLVVHNLSLEARQGHLSPNFVISPPIATAAFNNLSAGMALTSGESLDVIFRALLMVAGQREGFGQITHNLAPLPEPIVANLSEQLKTSPQKTHAAPKFTWTNWDEEMTWEKFREDLQQGWKQAGEFFTSLLKKKELDDSESGAAKGSVPDR